MNTSYGSPAWIFCRIGPAMPYSTSNLLLVAASNWGPNVCNAGANAAPASTFSSAACADTWNPSAALRNAAIITFMCAPANMNCATLQLLEDAWLVLMVYLHPHGYDCIRPFSAAGSDLGIFNVLNCPPRPGKLPPGNNKGKQRNLFS